MGDLFTHRVYNPITVDTLHDLSNATVTRIVYRKPDGTTGFWNATVDGTKLIYKTSVNDIDQPGLWEFESYVEFNNAEPASGNTRTKLFKSPI